MEQESKDIKIAVKVVKLKNFLLDKIIEKKNIGATAAIREK